MLRRLRSLLGLGAPTSLGARGERVAARRLRNAGYRVLARNVRLAGGEIDLLAVDPSGKVLVVVEVKSRRVLTDAGDARTPEAAITADKRQRLTRLAQAAAKHPSARSLGTRAVRIDVVAVDFDRTGRRALDVRHYPSAVGVPAGSR